jgi:hypothetical protein
LDRILPEVDGMDYHVVFDVSERFVDIGIGALALCVLVSVAVLTTTARGRQLLRRRSWAWLFAGGALWAAFGLHNIGGIYALIWSTLSVGGWLLGIWAFLDRQLPVRTTEGGAPSARSVAPMAACILLLLTCVVGSTQLPAIGLSNRLSSGDVTVVEGQVEDFEASNLGLSAGPKRPECFSVDGHRYCYEFNPISVGFHQTNDIDGPIRNGLHVRVSSVGDVIVRLEIANQP